MSGYVATSRRPLERTSLSRLALLEEKLPASTVTVAPDVAAGSQTYSSPSRMVNVACTVPRPNMCFDE